ncbi:hypothetical protein Dsin_018319 [Dipteronia sinensis]|uniref:Transposase n=1 Tax=Dipteronia sinensis TaxID=43782 RepID=A0AAE0A6K2_9ROSI|nr:hypothetical protein Dsin_018319 [Dipteronia sinensis]
MDNIFKINVLHGTNVIDLGQCDDDHVSLITLVYAMTEHITGSSKVPTEEYSVWVQLPWCSDVVEVFTDRDLLDVFREFGLSGFDHITFRVEQTCYKLCPPVQGSPSQPIEDPEVVEQICWYDDEADMFDYVADIDGECTESLDGVNGDGVGLGGNNGDGVSLDSDNGDSVGLDGGNGDDVGLDGDNGDGDNGDGVFESMFENVVESDEITNECMDLFEGYESRSDDEFSSDLDTDKSHVRVGKLLRAQRLGFLEGCRPFIGLDGCHLKGPCGGILLSEVALDANSGLFPLAVYMFCARHIYPNSRESYCGDSFKKLFWKASRSSNVYDFNAALKDIGEIKPDAKECWQISGIICPHAMGAISHNCGREALRDMILMYVHQCLTKSVYMQTYKGMIHPLLDQKMWPEIDVDEVLPPPFEANLVDKKCKGRENLVRREKEAGQ